MCWPYIETSQLICCVNQLTGFYMRATLALNGFIKHWIQNGIFVKETMWCTLKKLDPDSVKLRKRNRLHRRRYEADGRIFTVSILDRSCFIWKKKKKQSWLKNYIWVLLKEWYSTLIKPMCLQLSALDENLEFNYFSTITPRQNQRIESYWSVLREDSLEW